MITGKDSGIVQGFGNLYQEGLNENQNRVQFIQNRNHSSRETYFEINSSLRIKVVITTTILNRNDLI